MNLCTAIVLTACVGAGGDRPATCPSVADHAVPVARAALGARYFIDVDLAAMDATPRPTGAGAWTVTFSHKGRDRFRVRINAAGEIVDETFLDGDREAGSPGLAIDAARWHPPVAVYLDGHRTAVLDARYEVGARRWLVMVLLNGRVVGAVGVQLTPGEPPRIVSSAGPWEPATGWRQRLRRTWREIAPGLSTRAWLYVYVVLFIALFVQRRRLVSWRTLDVAAVAALLPAGLAVRAWPAAAYGALWGMSLYLFTRALARSRQTALTPAAGPDDGFGSAAVGPAAPGAGGARWLAALLVAVLAHQALFVPAAEWRSCDFAGLVGGDALFRDGAIPYGRWGFTGFDTYGPLHYILYGAAGRAFPTGVTFDVFNPVTKQPTPNTAGAEVLMWVFLVLTAGGLVVLGRRLTGRWSAGLRLAVGYCLLAPALGRFVGGAHRIPGALILLMIVGWPNPVWCGVLWGLAVGTMWFPVFLAPLLLGAFLRRGGAGRFAIAAALTGAALAVVALLGAESSGARLVDLVEAVPGRQELVFAGEAAGRGEGVWDGAWQVWPGSALVRVSLAVAFLLFSVLLVALPRRLDGRSLTALAAAVVVGTQVWKATHGGEYVAWYLPALLPALFLVRGRAAHGPDMRAQAQAKNPTGVEKV